ncbi:acetyl-CoA acetyltransferase [Legionella quinlivanii]|uniref:Acetyl-CoA acetyltransferase n=1 Tax=Legionella quinlivanii TaxID=45073 RepID=A0A0W0Y515_9GAMM|nr:acetyl-CoA C-acetyltransferase [Legionella quinlivanii]KTD52075.1 acetyl-CoA acetyltransferase [Legionella quinlivanii]MCW8452339.1 acetyl-CoA C-acetyltransferase [Legionella quinlivanii]SEF89402.1 acetyl-CoA C-acetyltransferase [Legionella quinlivanii DSM 21216]STY12429.1 acetyl-CoA acetyltransferase [Legionella quinlivanii]
MSSDVFICAPVRTAIGTFNGSLKNTPAPDLGAVVIRESLRRAALDSDTIQTVVMGQVVQAGAGMNPARQASIKGGLPVQVPAFTVNRVCGSGAQAIVSAYLEIISGNIDCAVAGGMENMDLGPYLLPSARWGYRLGDGKVRDSVLLDGLHDIFSGQHSGWHTEDLASKYQISREQQDAWALRSQQRFSKAQQAGDFSKEIVPVEIGSRKGIELFQQDEHNRADTTLEILAKLKPAFRPEGTITAGNAPGLNSGAAAMIIANAKTVERYQLEPMARIVAYGIAAVEPGEFGIGPVPAVKQALERSRWKLADVERVEINEAFAAISVAVMSELGLDESIVNVDGGAIAHGHPIGATGAILTTRLLYSMARDHLKKGLVTLCIGGGQGIALALER